MRCWIVAVCVPVMAACIIPDHEILIEDEFENRHPVKIVERTQLTEDADDACAAAVTGLAGCPQAPTGIAHFFDPAEYQFCSCDKGSKARDDRPLLRFSIYAEDADRTEEGDPLDELYGAFVLDSTSAIAPHERVVYRMRVNPQVPALDAAQPAYEDAIGRPSPALREFSVENENEEVDLCNEAKDVELDRGWHTVQFIVTDRPWFTPEDGTIQEGVPDLAAGATYDTTTYTFFCYHWEEDPEECNDQCVIPGD